MFALIDVVLTIILEIFAGNIMSVMQVPEASFDKAVSYVRICSGGILIIIAYNVISGVLRGVGNANLPFLFVGIACVVNIMGDLLFVAVWGDGCSRGGTCYGTCTVGISYHFCSGFVPSETAGFFFLKAVQNLST